MGPWPSHFDFLHGSASLAVWALGEGRQHAPPPAVVTGTAGIATTFHFDRECLAKSENESGSGSVRVEGFIYVPWVGVSEHVLVMEKVK